MQNCKFYFNDDEMINRHESPSFVISPFINIPNAGCSHPEIECEIQCNGNTEKCHRLNTSSNSMQLVKESIQPSEKIISEICGHFELHFEEENIEGSGCITFTNQKIYYYMIIDNEVISNRIPINNIIYIENNKDKKELRIYTTTVLHSIKLISITSGNVDRFIKNINLKVCV